MSNIRETPRREHNGQKAVVNVSYCYGKDLVGGRQEEWRLC